jgi:hypothetical protein
MEKQAIKQALIRKYEYADFLAEATSEQILELHGKFREAIEQNLLTGEVISIAVKDYDTQRLINEYEMTPPNAFIVLSRLEADYEGYSKTLRSGYK